MVKKTFPILWYEGMPLDPHVFQQNFLYHQDLNNFLLSSSCPYSWGVVNIEWETTYLAEGSLRIKNLEAIMPDRSIINFPQSKEDSLEFNLLEMKEELGSQENFVFLILPKDHVAHSKGSSNPRYKTENLEDITDMNTGEDEHCVSFMRPNCSLFVGKFPPERYIAIPLAKIKFSGVDFSFMEYDPPALNIQSTSFILNRVQNFVDSGRDKLKYLFNQTGEQSERANMMIINLAKILLPLEHMLQSKESISPYNLFFSLFTSIAHSLAFYKTSSLPIPPKYEHNNLLDSVSPILEFLETAMQSIKETYKRRKFSESNNIFGLLLDEDSHRDGNLIIGVQVNDKSSKEKTKNWIESAIIGTEDNLGIMQDKRITGLLREHIKEVSDLNLQSTDDVILVKLQSDKNFVTKDKIFCVMNFTSQDRPKNIFLYSEKKD